MKVLAIAATNHKQSINKKLIGYTVSILEEKEADLEIETTDLLNYEIPLYRQDIEENEGIPEKAKEFYTRIGEADAVIISFAEHNGSFTAVYKNLFDWMSRIEQKVYQDKPMIVMAATPGPRGGAGVLNAVEMVAPFFGMNIKAKVSVPEFQNNFDFESGKITNQDVENEIHNALSTLK